MNDLESSLNALSLNTVLGASVILVILLAAAMAFSTKRPKIKLPLFVTIATIVVGATLVISGATVYLNVKSDAGGPVHWHADVEFWACGNELELRDPQGLLSNKIGTPTLHEHNDKRIHLEGVPVTLPDDASLGKFMEVVGGELSGTTLTVPLNEDKLFENLPNEQDGDGPGAPAPELIQPFLGTDAKGKVARFASGQKCGDEQAEVQVFAYRFDAASKTYSQSKISHPARFGISGHGDIPPGDCVIFEFAPSKNRTDKLCKQYGIRDANRCEQFGVKPNERKICENTETTTAESEPYKRCQGANQYQGNAECAKLNACPWNAKSNSYVCKGAE